MTEPTPAPPALGGPVPAATTSPVDKSVGAALALTFIFGRLGLIYITVLGAVITTIIAIVIAFFTLGIGLLLIWPITMIWSAVTASKKHPDFEAWKIGRLAGGGPHYGMV